MWPSPVVVAIQRRGTGSAARPFPGNKSDSHLLNSHPEAQGQPSPHSINRRACRRGHCTFKHFDPYLCPHLRFFTFVPTLQVQMRKSCWLHKEQSLQRGVPTPAESAPCMEPSSLCFHKPSSALTNLENIPLLRSQPFSGVPGRGTESCGSNTQCLVPRKTLSANTLDRQATQQRSSRKSHRPSPQPSSPVTGRRAPSLGGAWSLWRMILGSQLCPVPASQVTSIDRALPGPKPWSSGGEHSCSQWQASP